MTQDVIAQTVPSNINNASSAVIGPLVADDAIAKPRLGSIRRIQPATRPPQNGMMRLAVLNALRPATYYSRL